MLTSTALRESQPGAAEVNHGPGRADWGVAWLLLVLSAAAVVVAGTALARVNDQPQQPATASTSHTPPAFTAGEVAAATEKTCAAWWTASEVMNAAANAVLDTPVGWDNPARQAARAHEADVSLTQTAYLKTRIDPATPQELKQLLNEYNALTFAKLDASVHRLGTQVDARIAEQNSVMRAIDSKCDK